MVFLTSNSIEPFCPNVIILDKLTFITHHTSMSIYTKTGDKGKTGIFGGTRIWKHELQIEAYGKVDEASSFIGLAFEAIDKKEIRDFLTIIQEDLYKIMAYLSAAPVDLLVFWSEPITVCKT
jgi:cob(I)alamin adenosyltransferase